MLTQNTEKTAIELTSPTAPGTNSGDVYHNWNTTQTTAQTIAWDFGSPLQFPILKASDSDALLPGQGVGLRSIQSSTADAKLSPTFSDAITFYTITPPSASSIDLTLTAYNRFATIRLVREGEATDYFAGRGSRGSASVPIAANSVLIITVSEPNLDPISYRVVLTTMPPCTLSIPDDDRDGVGQAMDIDKDGDGLIEVCDLEGLDAMRHVLDGSSYQVDATATTSTVGCPSSGCRGYELTRSLDFMDDDSYREATNRVTWTTGNGWEPVGDSLNVPFRATFDGNGHTISNLMINRTGRTHTGLFGYVRFEQSKIANLGLLDVNITGGDRVGGLVGSIFGAAVRNSYVTGSVEGGNSVGGLVGFTSRGSITNSYAATGSVTGSTRIGGLVGESLSSTIRSSYATGSVRVTVSSGGGLVGSNIPLDSNRPSFIRDSYAALSSVTGGTQRGGLVGDNDSMINNSYWLSGSTSSAGEGVAADTAKSSEQLTSGAGEIYSGWSPDAWDFGTSNQFPALKYTKDTNADYLTCSDTSPQTGTDQPRCGTLLPHQGMNIGDSSLREGLRELSILGVTATFTPSFGISTNNYVVTILLPDGITERGISLRLRAYNPDAEIQIFREGDSATDYFEGRMSGQRSSRIAVSEGTTLTIRVSEPDTDYTLTFDVDVGELPGIRVRAKVFLEGSLQ